MPELPEVEAIVRKLRKDAPGSAIRRVEVLRTRAIHPQKTSEIAHAEGGRILRVDRRGKNILMPLSNGYWLRTHLGMTGNVYVVPDARMHPATVRVLIVLKDGRGMVLDDFRVFGRVNVLSKDQVLLLEKQLGVEPLSRQFTVAHLVGQAKGSTKPAKIFLMDQQHIAGLGNIYSAEALFVARINPKQVMKRVPVDKLQALHSAIVEVLKKAIRVTTRAYKKPGYFEEADFWVYGREGEPCKRCGTKIKRIEQAARSTFYCPKCQGR
jgi:formamidopyrimidine-DNA glycosylase